MKYLLCLWLSVCMLSTCFAFIIPVSSTPVLRDDNLISNLLRVDPEDKKPETLATNCWLWQDDDCLVAYFECEIDSSFYLGSVATRDNAGAADYVRVQLITIPDAFYAYYYVAYPTGNLHDAVRTSDSMDKNWDSHYSYESKYDDQLWRVTMRIPLGELRFQQKLPYQWKLIITRNHKKAEQAYSFPYVLPDMKNDYFLKAQDITLSHPIKSKLDISFRPYIVKSYDMIEKTSSFDPDHLGLDVAFNPAQRTRIKLSVNPDFSDVPPDDAADNYNSKYPPYLAENRFFFTEDLDVFARNNIAFYSRRIVQPQLAYKITGRNKSYNWGALGAWDKDIWANGRRINRDDYYQVLALNPAWRKLKLNNYLLSRTNTGYYNHVFNGQYKLQMGDDYYLSSTIMGSTRKTDTDKEAKTGALGTLQFNAFPGNWNATAFYTRVSKDIYADMGYNILKDYHNWGGNFGWDAEQSDKFVKYQGFSVWASDVEYHPNTKPKQERAIEGNYYANFKPLFGLSCSVDIDSELDKKDKAHGGYRVSGSFNITRWDALNISGTYRRSSTLVYELYNNHNLNAYYLTLSGAPSKNISYACDLSKYEYDYAKLSIIDDEEVTLDNRYIIGNASLSYTHNQKLRFSSGISADTNDSYGVFSAIGYFFNLRYEFIPEYFLYTGYQSNQYQMIKSTYDSPLGEFYKASATAYVKISCTL
ncbi:MAG: hypothetical protein M0P99_00550 [Candidatus Cloacimonetes bacterium]|nr:hypothetical protein [Candidatus Cloacimonadota bacterium]